MAEYQIIIISSKKNIAEGREASIGSHRREAVSIADKMKCHLWEGPENPVWFPGVFL